VRPTYSHQDAATTYTMDRVTALGVGKLRATSGYLSAADYLAGDPLLVDPDHPHAAMMFGTGELLPGIRVQELQTQILGRILAEPHPDPVFRLAVEWLDCCIYRLNVTQDRATAVELGFTGRNELIAAVHTVRGIAREEATTYLMEDDQQA